MEKELPKQLEKYFDKLWPIPRSIMGPGFRDSLDILEEVMPMSRLNFKTGKKILDWTVPKEWCPKEAYIIDPNGRKLADFKENNVHLVVYSTPFKGEVSLSELKEHLYTLPEQPEAIPYITSYYKERWGFCLSHNEYKALKEGTYKVLVDTKLVSGKLVIGETYIKGRSKKEVLFSSYLCHPSLANNELSGPLVLTHLYKEIAKIKNRKFSYRFVLVPETIGSIAVLSQRGEDFKKNLVAGYVITCVGDKGPLMYKRSRRGNSLADSLAEQFMTKENNKNIIDFDPAIGSDERQYCSPGFNLPIGSLMRTTYTKYPEYHTSLDNKSMMDFLNMARTVEAYLSIVKSLEGGEYYVNKLPYGEPQLGKRGLFRTLSDKIRQEDELAMWWLLNYCDGTHDLSAIAELAKLSKEVLDRVAGKLTDAKILERI
ncbi:MAG: DUF4910 domain-containing protein [Candidatus Taylorbacteria bacterium]|nr:DUF4910 domain-containing protein [Candidatus Taylorbacteria bacterium]